jgi:hypothetical protein
VPEFAGGTPRRPVPDADRRNTEAAPAEFRSFRIVTPAPDPRESRAGAAQPGGDPILHTADAELDRRIAGWIDPSRAASDHLLRTSNLIHPRRRRGIEAPLDPAAPVPGCLCVGCVGEVAKSLAPRRIATEPEQPGRGPRAALSVEAARRVPILNIAGRWAIGPARKVRLKFQMRCPLGAHTDTNPSCDLEAIKNVWYCHGCGEGGDRIRLVMRILRVDFVDAVQWLVP